MQLFLIASGVDGADEHRVGRALARAAAAIPQLDPSTARTWGSARGGLVAAAVHHPPAAAAPRRYRAERGGEAVLYDGLPVARAGAFAAHDAAELLGRWPTLAEDVDGQFAAVRIDLEDGRAELVCDVLALVQVFAVRARGGMLVSNCVEALRAFAGLGEPDPRGLSTFISLGWVADDRCLLAGPRRLAGGCRHTLETGRLESRPFATLATLRAGARRRPAADLARGLAALTAGAIGASRHVRCGLTGGRDSRVVAALAVAAGAPVEYYTAGRHGDPDVQLGGCVAGRLGVPWQVEDPPPPGVDPFELTLRFVRQTDGLSSVAGVTDQFDLPPTVDVLGLKLWGTGGEIGRAGSASLRPVMTMLPLLRGSPAVQQLLLERSATRGNLLPSSAARSETRAFVREFFRRRTEEGWPAADLSHAFYVYERIARWPAPTLRRAAPAYDLLSPFCTREYVEFALALTPQERFVDAAPWQLLTVLAPELRDLPFSKPWRPRRLRAAPWVALSEAVHKALTRPGAPAQAGGRARMPVDHAWFERLVPALREVVSGTPDSPMWELVDRTQMSALLEGSYERRAGQVGPLQRAATALMHLHAVSGLTDRAVPRR